MRDLNDISNVTPEEIKVLKGLSSSNSIDGISYSMPGIVFASTPDGKEIMIKFWKLHPDTRAALVSTDYDLKIHERDSEWIKGEFEKLK